MKIADRTRKFPHSASKPTKYKHTNESPTTIHFFLEKNSNYIIKKINKVWPGLEPYTSLPLGQVVTKLEVVKFQHRGKAATSQTRARKRQTY